MRDSHAADRIISHSPDPRSATPLLAPHADSPDTPGRAQTGLGSGRMRDSGTADGGVGYAGAAAAATRRHQLRSKSPGGITRVAGKQKMVLAAAALVISLVSFVVQTETAVYIQRDLGWNKAYCMLYICHASWAILAPIQFLYLKSRKSAVPWRSFLRSHLQFIRSTAQMVQFNTNRISTAQSLIDPVPHFIKKIAIITCTLTVAGSSWFIALNLTTPSDLTAIYNCSAFFAYAFSIPLLGEKVRLGKVVSVAIAISGVMVVAYGDGSGDTGTDSGGGGGGGGGGVPTGRGRVLGNLMIGVGSVLYGLYEVIYKKMACPPESTSPGRSVIFANVVASSIGAFTLIVLWFPLVVLHLTGIEPFELPTGKAGWLMAVSALAGVGFSGGFLVLISLTSPVLSSVAALFTIFLVALADWLLTAVPLTLAAVMGGVLIIGAFGLLSWESWKELKEGEEKRLKRDDVDADDDVESPEEQEGASRGLGLSSAEERGRLMREAE